MRKYYLLLSIGLGLAILVTIKIVSNFRKTEAQSVKVPTPVVQVECYRLRDTAVKSPFRAVGYIKANERVDVVSELSRRLMAVMCKEGSQVKKDEVLFQLDDAEWVTALKKNNIETELAQQTENRCLTILESGGSSRQVYDEAVNHRKVLEAEAESLKVLIEKAKIRAPFSGKLGIRNVSQGAFVTPAIILTSLEDLSCMKIDFTIPERQANVVNQGDHFNFRIEGNAGDYTAVVEAVDPAINISTGSLRILARIESSVQNLVAGTAVTLDIENKATIPGLFVPSQSLLPTPAGYKIYLLRSGTAELKSVKTGFRTEKMVEIIEGVAKGDSILMTGLMKVKPGARLKVTKTL